MSHTLPSPATTFDRNAPHGVIAAAVTPLAADLAPDLAALPSLLDFLAQRGCHGALLLGTTGEGPAFSVEERLGIVQAALAHRNRALPGFRVLAGTGCANLPDTVQLTRAAFALGVDGVVVLPAFYFKGVSPAGIAAYFERVIEAAVPPAGRLLVYHIPQMSGVGIPAESLQMLRARFPEQAWGMKDSQDERAFTLEMARQFPGLGLFVGSDSLMSEALTAGAVGSITALANVTSPLNRAVWDAHQAGRPDESAGAQAALTRAREAMRGLAGPSAIKAALAGLFGFPAWPVRPPLAPLAPEASEELVAALRALLG
jgi:4-hydroxy-tetrahydrodipicolinate synthase